MQKYTQGLAATTGAYILSSEMSKLIKSSDVLDVNSVTKVEMEAEVIGLYRPTGPNSWDDWELIREAGGEVLTVEPESQIQLEPLGADPEIRFRLRARRKVWRLRWKPDETDKAQLESGEWGVQESDEATFLEKMFGLGPKDDPRDDMLEYFLATKSVPYESEPGMGYAAMLVKKLRGK